MLDHPLGRDQVGLGRQRDLRRLGHLGRLGDQEPVARPDLVAGRQADADHVDLGPGRLHHVVQPLTEQRPRLVQPGGVDQDQLRVGPVHDPPDGVPSGLRLGGGDHDLLPDQRVREGRLARVRAADKTGEAGLELRHTFSGVNDITNLSVAIGNDYRKSGSAEIADHLDVDACRVAVSDHGGGLDPLHP